MSARAVSVVHTVQPSHVELSDVAVLRHEAAPAVPQPPTTFGRHQVGGGGTDSADHEVDVLCLPMMTAKPTFAAAVHTVLPTAVELSDEAVLRHEGATALPPPPTTFSSRQAGGGETHGDEQHEVDGLGLQRPVAPGAGVCSIGRCQW